MRERLAESIENISLMRERVVELEDELNKIKHDEKWRKSIGYLRVAAHNGEIDESPGRHNRYRIPKVIE